LEAGHWKQCLTAVLIVPFGGEAFVKRLEDNLSRPPEASPETLRGER
jgi:hypothetical protein